MSVTEPLIVDRNSRGFGNTYFNSEKFGYTWTIHDFSHTTFRTDGSYLESPTFQTLHNGIVISWRLGLGYDNKSPWVNDIYYSVNGSVSKECKISAKFEFSIINTNIKKNFEAQGTITKECPSGMDFVSDCAGSYFAYRQSLPKYSGYCPNDKLTIVFDITLGTDQLSVSNKHDSNRKIPDCRLVGDIGALFGDKRFCDVKLKVSGTRRVNSRFPCP